MFKCVGDENEVIPCPYDESHQIIRHRFQVHLVRCRKNHLNAEVITCPFNISHRINKQELQWHVSNCPERQTFENFKHREQAIEGLTSSVDTTFCGDTTMRNTTYNNTTRFLDSFQIESSENWDDEPEVPAYDPKDYLQGALVLRAPVGMPPSQRNAFRDAERKRLQSLMKY